MFGLTTNGGRLTPPHYPNARHKWTLGRWKATNGKRHAEKVPRTQKKKGYTMKTYGVLNDKGEQFRCGAPVVIIDDNGTEHLISYNTEILQKDKNGTIKRVWTGWSQTTGKHIKAYCGLNKAGYEALDFV